MTDPGQEREPSAPGGSSPAGAVGGADGIGDGNVSRRYREAARERAPAALDERIRAEARRAPARRGWQRPLAVAATLALAVSLVLQVTIPTEEHAPAPDADTPPAAAAAPAGRAAESARAADGARQRVFGTRRLSEHALQPDRSGANETLTELGEAGRKAANSLAGATAAPVSVRCAGHIEDARAWAACIAALEAAGEAAAAERERRAWDARHGQEEAVAH